MTLRSVCAALFLFVFATSHALLGDGSRTQQLLRLINSERAKVGAPALRSDEELSCAAQEHSREMAKRGELGHRLPGEEPLEKRAAAAGVAFDAVGENVGRADSVEEAHSAFMHSSGHRANLLNPAYNAAGIGIVKADGRLFVTEDFVHSVAKLSAVEVEELVVKNFNAVRKQARMAALPRLAQPGLRQQVCQPNLTAGKIAKSLAGNAWVVVFSSAQPGQLPAELKSLAAEPRARGIAVGACHPESSSYASFIVATVLTR